MPSTPEGRTTLPCWWGGRCGRIQAEASGLSDLMPVPDLVILSTRVVTGEGIRPAAVAIADGVITAVHEHGGPPDAARQLDVGDAALLPGVVDTHVHVNEPGRTEWEGFETATRAAAAGGITTIVDMPLNSIPPTTTLAGFREKLAAAKNKCLVDVGFWGGVVPGNTSELAPLLVAGVVGFKCFLIHSGVDEFPNVTEKDLRGAMPELTKLGAVLIVHAELPGPISRTGIPPGSPAGQPRWGGPACTSAAATAKENGVRPISPDRIVHPTRYATFLASRPRAAENEAVALMIKLSRKFGT